MQFIVQKRRGGARARPWQAEAYILDPKALSPVLHRRSLGIPPEDVAAIMAELHQARVTEAT